MSSLFVVSIHDLEGTLGTQPDFEFFDEKLPEERARSRGDFATLIAPHLDRLPDLEADILEMYYLAGKKQAEIAVIVGLTQAAVSYRLRQAQRRIRFLKSVPQLDDAAIREVLSTRPEFDQLDHDILTMMAADTCQTSVATKLGVNQSKVRTRMRRAVRILTPLAKVDGLYKPCLELFTAIIAAKAILHETKMPRWHDPDYRRPGGGELV